MNNDDILDEDPDVNMFDLEDDLIVMGDIWKQDSRSTQMVNKWNRYDGSSASALLQPGLPNTSMLILAARHAIQTVRAEGRRRQRPSAGSRRRDRVRVCEKGYDGD